MSRMIGTDAKGDRYYYNENSANSGFLSTGRSGMGKTQAILSQAVQAAESGESRVLVLNWRKTVSEETIAPELYSRYKKLTSKHNIAKEGLSIPLFEKATLDDGTEESDNSLINHITGLFTYACGLSPTQKSMAYKAIKDIYANGYYKESGIEVVYNWLNSQKSATAKAAAGKLLSLCGTGMLKNGPFFSDTLPITEVDLNDLEYNEQSTLVRFILCYIQREAMKGSFFRNPVVVFVDEIQNVFIGKELSNPIEVLLNEGRKLNVKLLLACPSSIRKGTSSALMQCATALHFQPLGDERNKLAEIIDPQDPEAMNYALSILKIGECIAKGSFEIVSANGKTREEEGIFRLNTKLVTDSIDDGYYESEAI